jgi:hypothetical protein
MFRKANNLDKNDKPISGFCRAVTMLAVATLPTCATTVTVTVPGLADVWLAGQQNGSTLGNDVAPTNSPVLGSGGLTVTAGNTLTFSATGSTSLFGSVGGVGSAPTPDGMPGLDSASANNLSGLAGPSDALVGVFIGSGVPTGSTPAALDFSTMASQSAGTISPLLQQVFFIGDGLTGTGTGSTQLFTIPSGATRLFLGSSDTAGSNFNNSGFFTVNVSDISVPSAAPEPTSGALLVIAALLLLISRAIRNHLMRANCRKDLPPRSLTDSSSDVPSTGPGGFAVPRLATASDRSILSLGTVALEDLYRLCPLHSFLERHITPDATEELKLDGYRNSKNKRILMADLRCVHAIICRELNSRLPVGFALLRRPFNPDLTPASKIREGQLMRIVLWITVFACCSPLYSQTQTRAETALNAEPEMQDIIRVMGIKNNPGYTTTACPPSQYRAPGGSCMTLASVWGGLVQSRNAAKAAYIYENRLRARLKAELLYNVCGTKCPVKEQELVLLQQMIDQNDPAYVSDDPKQWKQDEDRERVNRGDWGGTKPSQSVAEIQGYCMSTSGWYNLDPRASDAERQAAGNRMNACKASYNIGPQDFRRPDTASAEVAHRIVLTECLKLYDHSKSVYDQQPYNACMNKRDIPTQLCTKLRESAKSGPNDAGYVSGGTCAGPQPLDVHDLGLGLPPR